MAIERGVAAKANDLAAARRQIAALEAKVGRQQLDLDFFKKALQRIEASRRVVSASRSWPWVVLGEVTARVKDPNGR